jgi:6-phosphofructokinase 1
MAEGAGNSFAIADQIEKCTGFEVRVSVVGYIQRGGSPTARSRKLAGLFGIHAVKTLIDMKENDKPRVVGICEEKIIDYDLECIFKHKKDIDLELYNTVKILAT